MSNSRIEDRLDVLNEKIDIRMESIDGRLDTIEKVLIQQEANLKHHIYRTELAEKRLEHIEDQIVPVTKHITRIDGVLKFLGFLTLVGGVILTFLKIFSII